MEWGGNKATEAPRGASDAQRYRAFYDRSRPPGYGKRRGALLRSTMVQGRAEAPSRDLQKGGW